MKIKIDEIIDKVFDGFKRLTPALFALTLATGIILFAPDEILYHLGLKEFPEWVRGVLGLLFVIATSIILVLVIYSKTKRGIAVYKDNKTKRKLRKQYANLSESKKNLIIRLMNSKNQKIQIDIYASEVQYLKEKHFIRFPSTLVSIQGQGCVIGTISPELWLIELFDKEPELFAMN